ncbi:MAG: hypothetical protein IKR49_05725 [Clostridia bacterium]|jgi:hypothetical protein|nr:hypothetical protein [Clostridia bacterium]
MKKVLSVFLAVLMVFSVMAMSASAAVDSPYFGGEHGAKENQCVFMFRLNGGTCKSSQNVYDTTKGQPVYTNAEDVPQVFVIVPDDERMFLVDSSVTLPSVKAPKGQSFVGWQRVPAMDGDKDNGTYSTVPGGYIVKAVDIGRVVEFRAVYQEAEMEEDTFAKVFEILVKIFGTLIGLIAYQGNVEKGQDFMNKIFSSISG